MRLLLILAAALLTVPAHAGGFTICEHSHPARQGCVVDGDTFWFKGEKVRPVGFDAPESAGQLCAAEGPIYRQARARLLELLNGGDVSIDRTGTDRYGRTLATVTVGGRDLGAIMIGEGLARPWRGKHWCG